SQPVAIPLADRGASCRRDPPRQQSPIRDDAREIDLEDGVRAVSASGGHQGALNRSARDRQVVGCSKVFKLCSLRVEVECDRCSWTVPLICNDYFRLAIDVTLVFLSPLVIFIILPFSFGILDFVFPFCRALRFFARI